MFNRLAVWLTNYSLKKSDLSLEDRNKIITNIMGSLDALPIYGIIDVNEDGEVLVSGRSLDLEKAKQIRESASLALDNIALKIVNEQVLFTAVTGGMHNATLPEHLYFYRAAIWFGQQLERQLKILAQRVDGD